MIFTSLNSSDADIVCAKDGLIDFPSLSLTSDPVLHEY